MKAKFSTVFKYLLFLSLAIGMLYWAFRGQNLQHLANSLKAANPYWIAASVLACLFAHLLRAIRWIMLIKPLGYQVSKRNAFYAVMTGYLANLAFPRMGEVSRCGVLNKTDKIPMNQLLGTVITERVSDLLMLISITGLAILLEFERISNFIYQYGWLKIEQAASGAFSYGLLIILVLIFVTVYVLKSQIKTLLSPLSKTFSGLKNGILSFRKMPDQSAFIMYAVLIWFFYFLSTYCCFFALGATSNLGLLAALATLVFGSLGMVVPVQGGIGAFHFMVAEGLSLYAIPKVEGLSFATLIHSSQIVLILVLGAWSLLMVVWTGPKTKKTVED